MRIQSFLRPRSIILLMMSSSQGVITHRPSSKLSHVTNLEKFGISTDRVDSKMSHEAASRSIFSEDPSLGMPRLY